MSLIKSFRTGFQGLTDAILRFPVTILLLLALAVMNAIVISTKEFDNYTRLTLTFLIGAMFCAVSQMVYEHFHREKASRLIYLAGSAAFTLAYYFLIGDNEVTAAISIRTMVFLFLLLAAFLWLPTIRSTVDFNVSFLAAFKAFWVSVFFTGVLFLGLAIILGAISLLLVPIRTSAYAHGANIVFVLLAPLYFLSLIPRYPAAGNAYEGSESSRTEDNSQKVGQATDTDRTASISRAGEVPPFLASLLTYVIIPVTAIFTLILLVYILLNIREEFWTDSLLEPLLVSYSITVIIVYLLVSRLSNPMANAFRRIFPKVLLPVVLFQTLSSCLRIGAEGITHGRYYAILFGFFATVAGLLFCFLPVRKNGLIAPLFIILALLSIIPPVDAFTVSRSSQIGRLERVLSTRGMLVDDAIVPNPNLSEADQKKIINAIDYLERMDYTDEISWLSDYSSTYNFEKTFGFSRYGAIDREYRSLYFYLNPETMIGISGYDFLYSTTISNKASNLREASFLMDGIHYYLDYERSGEHTDLLLIREEEELLRLSVNDIFDRFDSWGTDNYSTEISEDDARFTAENERAILTLTVRNLNIDYWQDEISLYADAYILIRMK